MSGILGMMDIAKNALAAEQLAVEVTSHNIANVNTPGYSRQTVLFETSPAVTFPYGPVGHGVQVTGIERAFDAYVTAKLDEHTSSLSDYQTLKSNLDQIASLFNETQSGGVNDLLSGFWSAWHDVADNPSGAAERQTLLNKAANLAEAFNFQASQLVQARTSITQSINPIIDEINSHIANIADLNRQITETETTEHPANDLRDQRQVELNELSKLINIRYYNVGNSTINVSLADGTGIVQGVDSWGLQSAIVGNNVQVTWQGPGGPPPPPARDVTAAITSGELAATIQVRDEFIPQYQSDLDDIAKELVAAVNTAHSQGAGLDLFSTTTSSNYVNNPAAILSADPGLSFGSRIQTGSFYLHLEDANGVSTANTAINITAGAGGTTLNDVVTAINAIDPAHLTASVVTSGSENHLQITTTGGYKFGFAQDTSNVLMALGVNTFFKGNSAYTIGVNDAVANDTNLIAAGQIDTTTGAHPPGDNTNALVLADLENQTVGPNSLTFADAYRGLVTGMGLDAEEAGSNKTFYQGLVDQFQQLRDSVSGVSLDDELTNLIKFQRSYQAAAKMVSVGDEMLQTLLTLKT